MMSVDEQIEEIKALTLDQAKDFYQQFYGASNGELTVIGDFDSAAILAQVGQLFGDWKSPKSYTRVVSAYSDIHATAQVIETPDKANSLWATGPCCCRLPTPTPITRRSCSATTCSVRA